MTSWPAGTEANASSTHASNPATLRTFIAYNAIDGDTATFWNDNTEAVFPDKLTIIIPPSTPVNLTGLQVVSDPDGWNNAYDVYLYVGSTWIKAVSVSGLTTFSVTIRRWTTAGDYADSKGVVSGITAVMISVTAAADLGGGAYSRVNEVYPIYAVISSSSTSSLSASSTSTSLSSSSTTTSITTTTSNVSSAPIPILGSRSNTGAIAGGVAGGVLAIVALIGIGILFYKRKQKKDQNTKSCRCSPAGTTMEANQKVTPQLLYELNGNKRAPAEMGSTEFPIVRDL